MPNLWKFLSKGTGNSPQIQEYRFTAAEELELPEDLPEPEEEAPQSPVEPVEASPEPAPQEEIPEEEEAPARPEEAGNPIAYAQLQSELLLEDARRQAEELLQQARNQAAEELETARKKAVEDGYREGLQQGIQEGTRQALEEGRASREAQAERLEEDVEAFLQKAGRALDQQMEENLTDLRDLALAVAEKVVCVSLKSSSEVIGKMIQTAVDKRKRRQWVHIYIAECDAKRLTALPPALASALSELSDHVRIIPMAGDESGTCIIECPDEIIDASAATQLHNIRELLGSSAVGPVMPGAPTGSR